MVRKVSLSLFLFFFLLLCFACEKVPENKSLTNENQVNFCSLVDAPQKYESKIIQTKAIVLGYHTFIFYNSQCLEQSKVLALEMSYESRRKIGEALNAKRTNYKTSFLNNNLYAEIIVLGELKENDESLPEVFHPTYKFFVNEIKNVNVLSEEVFPTDEARGARIINK